MAPDLLGKQVCKMGQYVGSHYFVVGLSDFINTAIYIDILFPDKVSIFLKFNLIFFLANFIEKSEVTISENTEH